LCGVSCCSHFVRSARQGCNVAWRAVENKRVHVPRYGGRRSGRMQARLSPENVLAYCRCCGHLARESVAGQDVTRACCRVLISCRSVQEAKRGTTCTLAIERTAHLLMNTDVKKVGCAGRYGCVKRCVSFSTRAAVVEDIGPALFPGVLGHVQGLGCCQGRNTTTWLERETSCMRI
jgi:hypothetical protein